MSKYCILHRPAWSKPHDEPQAYTCEADNAVQARATVARDWPDSAIVFVFAQLDLVECARLAWRDSQQRRQA